MTEHSWVTMTSILDRKRERIEVQECDAAGCETVRVLKHGREVERVRDTERPNPWQLTGTWTEADPRD